jgi:hypothetical protein
MFWTVYSIFFRGIKLIFLKVSANYIKIYVFHLPALLGFDYSAFVSFFIH